MESFNDMLRSQAIKPQEKPQYPSQKEIQEASIQTLAFWVLHLPCSQHDKPNHDENMKALDSIARRVYEFRKAEGSWKGPSPFEEVH